MDNHKNEDKLVPSAQEDSCCLILTAFGKRSGAELFHTYENDTDECRTYVGGSEEAQKKAGRKQQENQKKIRRRSHNAWKPVRRTDLCLTYKIQDKSVRDVHFLKDIDQSGQHIILNLVSKSEY